MPLACIYLGSSGCWPWWLNREEVVRCIRARVLFEEGLSSYCSLDEVADFGLTWEAAESWWKSFVNVPGRYLRGLQADGSQR